MNTSLHRMYSEAGQSPWLDNLRRGDLDNGRLNDLIASGVRGLTSNPTIFQKSIQSSTDYDMQLKDCIARGLSPTEAYWEMVIADIDRAALIFAPIHQASGGDDGFVSVEVDPRLAHDSEGTIQAARELRRRVQGQNVMIKIPATPEGLPAITQLTAEGCSVNVTLIFSLARYGEVLEAYMEGLEQRLAAGGSIEAVRSVASFFISRVDTAIDAILESRGEEEALSLCGKSAVNQARLAYDLFREVRAGDRWRRLADAGAHVQRPLWASTSTKNPSYRDVLYVEELIGPDSVNTLPESTLEAFMDHGSVATRITEDIETSRQQWFALAAHGVDVDEVARTLEDEGVASFVASFEDLIASLTEKSSV